MNELTEHQSYALLIAVLSKTGPVELTKEFIQSTQGKSLIIQTDDDEEDELATLIFYTTDFKGNVVAESE